MDFIHFNGGTFRLGETGTEVIVKPFEMGIVSVTNLDYEEFDPQHCKKRNEYSDRGDQPVVNVSWEYAIRYCQWLSEKTGIEHRLPTEAEWEYAASGGGKREYPWGDEEPTPERANYSASKIGKTTPVGSYPPTPEGLFDMAGNVWEWCGDWYDKGEIYRVLRGGSFNYGPDYLRCANRVRYYPHFRYFYVGFRVVRGVKS